MTDNSNSAITAFDKIADEARWVAWREEKRKGKPTKVPYCPHGGKARVDDPQTWGPRAEAAAKAEQLVNGKGNGGVGIVLGDLGNGFHLIGIDLDSCVDEDSRLARWAEEILALLPSYVERSPSSTGIKAFLGARNEHVRPFLDQIGVARDKWGTKRSVGADTREHGPAVEVYCSHRYFTVTEQLWPGKPNSVDPLDWPALEQLALAIAPYTPECPGEEGGYCRPSYNGRDNSRSAIALAKGAALFRAGKTFEEMCEVLRTDPETADWYHEKGEANGMHELYNIRQRAAADDAEITRLANLSELEYARERMVAAKKLGCQVQLLDRLVKGKQQSTQADHTTNDNEHSSRRKVKPADMLIALAASAAGLFHNPDNIGYADLWIDGHRETWLIRSKEFKRWLTHQFFKQNGRAPNTEALQVALNTIDAKALFEGPRRAVHVRIGEHGDKIYIDLADEEWHAVEIDADGWRVMDTPPVRFRRAAGMRPLAVPRAGGSIEDLRPFLNVKTNRDFILLATSIVYALRGRGPYPVVAILGEGGTAKTTVARVMRELIDASSVPFGPPPREDRDIFIATRNSYVTAYDNLSSLPVWLSDALCRLSTGGGYRTRALYTDDEEALFDAMRPVILTAINNVVIRGDLADRALMFTLAVIPDDKRRSEDEFWARFREAQPSIFGALLDAVAHGLRVLHTVRLPGLPRMADFAIWGVACEGALWFDGAFMAAYGGNLADVVADTIEADWVAKAVRSLMEQRTEWSDTATALLDDLAMEVGEAVARSAAWPKAPHVLSGRLRKAAPALRKVGINIDIGRVAQERWVKITRSGGSSDQTTPASDGGPDADSDADDAPEMRASHPNPAKTSDNDACDASDATAFFYENEEEGIAEYEECMEEECAHSIP
jgi:hypothetical protein